MDEKKEEKKYNYLSEKQKEASLSNLKKSNLAILDKENPERAKEIRRKGWEAMTAIKGERKNAKQSLEQFLPIFASNTASNEYIPQDIKDILRKNPNIKVTQYDLIMLSMIAKAQQGDVKASEFVANHFGDVVTKEVHNVNDSMSEADRELISKLSRRMGIDTDIIDVD